MNASLRMSSTLVCLKAWIIRAPLQAALLVAIVVALPSVITPFAPVDDYLHQLILEENVAGQTSLQDPYTNQFVDSFGFVDLFRFFTGDEEINKSLVQQGAAPWWTWERVQISFFRPLSNLLMVLDYRLFGRNAIGYRMHSVLWYLLFVVAGASVLRRTVPARVSTLAILLFAADVSHSIPVAWIANRNALVAGAFSLAAVLFHIKGAKETWLPGRIVSAFCLAFGLAAGEVAVGAFAYLIAFEALANSDPWRTKVARLLPHGVIGLAYVIAYKLGGYGALGSGLYISPLRETTEFLHSWLIRFPMLIAMQVSGVPMEALMVHPSTRPWLWSITVLAIAFLAWLLRMLWPTLKDQERIALRWLGAGALLSACPAVAAIVSSRLLLLPSLGGSVLSAVAILWGWDVLAGWRSAATAQRLRGLVSIGVTLRYLVWCPLIWWGGVPVRVILNRASLDAVSSLSLHPEEAKHETLVVLTASDPLVGVCLRQRVLWERMPMPWRWYHVSSAASTHRLSRVTSDTLELESLSDSITGAGVFSSPFRSDTHPVEQGYLVKTDSFDLRVERVREGRVERVSMRFPRSIETYPVRFVAWEHGKFAHVSPPPVGQSVDLPWFHGPMGM